MLNFLKAVSGQVGTNSFSGLDMGEVGGFLPCRAPAQAPCTSVF